MVNEDCDYYKNLTQGGKSQLTSNDISFYVYYYTLLFLILIVNIVGNSFVIFAFVKQKRLRCPTNYFIVSLAFSDIVMGITYAVYNISHMEIPEIQMLFGKWTTCVVLAILTHSPQLNSSCNLVALTVNRYIAVTNPDLCNKLFNWKWTLLSVILMWIGCSSLITVLYISPEPASYCGMCRYEMVWGVVRTICFTSTTVVLPLIIMSAIYIKLCLVIKTQLRVSTIHTENTNNRISSSSKMERNKHDMAVLRMATLLLGYFALAWIPTQIFVYISMLCTTCNINDYIRATVRLLTMSNSAINVFIYAGRHPDFKDFFVKTLRNMCCQNHCRRKRIHDQQSQGQDFETISQLHLEITRVKRRLSNQYKIKESPEDCIAELDAASLCSYKSVV